MKQLKVTFLTCAVLLTFGRLQAQTSLNPNPSRVIGQNSVMLTSTAPNLAEGREFNSPQGVAVDAEGRIYVSDTGNNRVLAWRDAAAFTTGAPSADLVIGQRDFVSTTPLGPNTAFKSGLNQPTGLAVDRQGNLWVVDSGNHRILRFPTPFGNSEMPKLPDIVLGQPNLDTRAANQGTGAAGPATISLNVDGRPTRGSLALDSAGNLYFTDAGNHRVIRYAAPQHNGDSANFVIGQPNLLTRNSTGDRNNRTGLNDPEGLAIDQVGNLYVTDRLSRMLIFAPNSTAAFRILGVGQQTEQQTNLNSVFLPRGVVVVGDRPLIVDTGNNRILVYDPTAQLSDNAAAKAFIGQLTDQSRTPGSSGFGLSSPVAGAFAGNDLYVADTGNHRVVVFRHQGGSVFSSGTRLLGQFAFDLSAPNLIEGRELFLFAGYESISGTPGSFALGGGIAVDRRSDPPRLYIADTHNNRVLAYADARKAKPGDKADLVIGQVDMVRSLINSPVGDVNQRNDTGMYRPTGLVVDADGNLWVADSGNSRVLRFPTPFTSGQFPQRADVVLGQFDFTSRNTDPTSRTMALPYGLALTVAGDLLVSDGSHNRILVFQKGAAGFSSGMAATFAVGQPNLSSSFAGNSPNRFIGPRHIATDTSDRLYVADTGNRRVSIFNSIASIVAGNQIDPSPAVILDRGTTLNDRLNGPHAIAVSSQTGEIWVGDTVNNRVLKYPEYGSLAPNFTADPVVMQMFAPLAAALDSFGNLMIAEGTNRVSMYYPLVAGMSAANYGTQRVAPGMYLSLKTPGSLSFGGETKVFNEVNPPVPMTKNLADIQIMVQDQPAPIHFVSPNQINFFMPWNAPTSGLVDILVVRPSTGQIVASTTVRMDVAAPGLFTRDATGGGQIAALIYKPNSNDPPACNGPDGPPSAGCLGGVRAVAPGEVLALFGTGQGPVSGAPADGEVTQSDTRTSDKPRVFIEGITTNQGYVDDSAVEYSGLGPGQIGVWQINVRIPDGLAPGNRIILVQYKGIFSSFAGMPNQTTIAVKSR